MVAWRAGQASVSVIEEISLASFIVVFRQLLGPLGFHQGNTPRRLLRSLAIRLPALPLVYQPSGSLPMFLSLVQDHGNQQTLS